MRILLASLAALALAGCSGAPPADPPATAVDYGLYCYNVHSEGGRVPTQAELDKCVQDVMEAARQHDARQ
jgi:hypothetical protein